MRRDLQRYFIAWFLFVFACTYGAESCGSQARPPLKARIGVWALLE